MPAPRWILSFLLFTLFGVLTTPTPASEPIFTFQRIHVLVAGHDNRISLRVWDDGRMEMRFPPYTTRAGFYQRTLSSDEYGELTQILEQLPSIAQDQLSQRLDQARSATLAYVADADIVRFEYRRDHAEDIALYVPAPDVWSRIARDIDELAAVAATEQALRGWMDVQIARTEGVQ